MMKKFTIFFLMMLMYLGNQVRCEAYPSSRMDLGYPSSEVALAKAHSAYPLSKKAGVDATQAVVVTVHGPQAACSGTVVLTAVVTDNNPMDTVISYTYQWYKNGNPITVAQNPTAQTSTLSLNVDNLEGGATEFYVEVTKAKPVCVVAKSPRFYFTKAPMTVSIPEVTVCEGQPITLEAMVDAPYAYSNLHYTWSKTSGGVTSVVGNSPTLTITNYNAGDTYKVRVYDYNSSCNAESVDATINVRAATAATLVLNPDNTSICANGTITLTAEFTDATLTVINPTYTWYRNGLEIGRGYSNQLTDMPTMPGTYSYAVSLVAEDAYQCVVADSLGTAVEVNVSAKPVVAITGAQDICKKSATDVELFANVTGAQGALTFTWFRDNVAATGTTTPLSGTTSTYTEEPAAAQSEPYNFTVKVSDAATGCEVLSDAYPVRINPEFNAYIMADASTVCSDGIVTLTAYSNSTHTDDLVYQWYRGGAAPSTANAIAGAYMPTHTSEAITANTKFFVVITDNITHCSDTASVDINVNNTPIQFDLGTDVTICAGSQVQLSATVTGGIPSVPYVYSWYRGGELLEGFTSNTCVDVPLVTTGSSEYTYKLEVTQAVSGCPVVEHSKKVMLAPVPNVVIAGNPIICDGSNIAMNANITDGVAADTYTYEWREENAHVGSNNALYTITKAARPAPYVFTVKVTSNTTQCSAISEPFYAYVNVNPQVEVTPSAETICDGGSVTLTANVASEGLIYRWYTVNGGVETPIPGATSSTLTVSPATIGDHHYKVKILQPSNGCEAEGAAQVTVQDKSTITLTPAVSEICEGTAVTLEATELTNGTYTWYCNGQVVENANQPTLVVTPTTNHGYDMTYTYSVVFNSNNSGCVTNTATATVNVHRNSTVMISGNSLLCDGGTVNLTANINDLIPSATYTYTWRKNNATQLEDATVNTYTEASLAPSTTPYIYTVIVKNDVTSCEVVSAPFYVYVNSNVQVQVTATDSILCPTGTATLTANIGGGIASDLTYEWKENGTVIDGATAPSIEVAPAAAGVYTYAVKISGADGCEANGTKKITVYDAPTVALSTPAYTDVCIGGQVSYAATTTTTIPDAVVTYNWYDNNQPIVEGATVNTQVISPSIVDDNLTQHTYAVVAVIDAPGCVSQPANSTIKVHSNPVVFLSGDGIICDGADVELTANVAGFINATDINVEWYLNGEAVTTTPVTIGRQSILIENNAASSVPYVYTVKLVAGDGCEATSNPHSVYVMEEPVVNILASQTEACIGAEVTFTARLDNENEENITYQWSKNTTTQPGETAATFTTSFDAIGTQEVSVTVFNTESECRVEKKANLTVVEALTLTVNTVKDSVCSGYQVNVTAEAQGGNINDTIVYTWFRNGVEIEGVHTPQFSEVLTADVNPTTYIYSAIAYQPSTGCESQRVSDTIVVIPAPTVQIAGDPIICHKTKVQLTAHVNNYPLSEVLTYRWMESDTTITGANARDFEKEYPKRDYPYIFTVQVSNALGCVAVSEPYAVYVNDTILLQVTHDQDSICPGAEVTFTANLGDYNATNLVYRWSKVVGGVATEILGATQPTYTATPTEIGKNFYQVKVLQTTSGCEAIGRDSIKVVSAPEVEIIAVSDTAVCDGGQITITATPLTDGYYTWYKNGVRVEGATLNYIVDSPVAADGDPTNYTYGVVFTPITPGCTSLLVDTTISVYANPTLVISGDAILCTQTANNVRLRANFADTVSAAILGFTYEWRKDNREVTSVVATSADSLIDNCRYRDEPYIYTVVATNSRGCTVTSEPYAVFVNDSIIVEVTSTVDSICEGGEVTLTANLGNYNSPDLVYRWYTTNGADVTPIWGATERILVVEPTTTTNYLVRVTQTTSMCEALGYDTIKVIAKPELELVLSEDTICAGGEVSLVATPNALAGSGTYTWFKNSVIIPGATTNTLVDSPLPVDNDPTYYTYQVIYAPDVVGCMSDTARDTVYVFRNPSVVITGDPLVCNYRPDNVSLRANVNDSYDTTLLSYEWRLANVTVGTDASTFDTTLTATDNPYIFTVQVSNEVGCVTTSDEYYVYVNDSNAIQVEITADNDSVCKGGEITMTGHLADYNSANLTYQWYYINAATGDTVEIAEATELSYTVVMDATTTFLVKITQPTSGCVAWGKKEIFVYPDLPYRVAMVDAVSLAYNQEWVCDGGEIDVTVSIQRLNLTTLEYEPSDSTDFSYVWFRNGFEDVNLHGPWFRESPLAVDGDSTRYTYSSAIILDIPGCKFSNSMADTITVVRNPVVDIYGKPFVCEYNPIVLNARVNGDYQNGSYPGASEGTFYWYRNGEMRTGFVPTIYGEYYEEPTYTTSGSSVIGDPTTGYANVFKVEYVNANGCSAFSPEFTVEVIEAPVVNITANNADNSVNEHRDAAGSIINAGSLCQGGQVTLTANLDNQNIPYLVYVWYENERLASNIIPGAVYPTYTTPALDTTTKYIVDVYSRLVLDAEDHLRGLGDLCVATHEYTVHVETDPVVEKITINGVKDTTICEGGQVRVEATIRGGVQDRNGNYEYVYTWYRNNTLLEGVTGSFFYDSPVTVDGDITNYEYSVAVSQIYSGCQSADTTRATLHVYPNPTVVISGDPIMCTVDTVVLNANVTGEYVGSNLTYTWKLANDTLRNNQVTPNVTVKGSAQADQIKMLLTQSDNPYIFTVVVANENGCVVESAPFYQYVDTAAVIQVTASEDSICRGGNTILTANIGDYNMPNLTYTWEQRKVGTTTWSTIHGAFQREITVAPDSTTEYQVSVLQTTSACLGTGNITIKVNDIPQVDTITLSTYTICDGGVVTVTGEASRGVGNEYTYTWYRNGEPMEGVVDASFFDYPLAVDGDTTNYIYSAFVSQTASGCVSNVAYAVKLTVYPNPTVVISYDPTVCENDTITLAANVTNQYPGSNLTYTWLLDNDTIKATTAGYVSGATNDTLRVKFAPRDHNYIFTVVVANTHGCTSASAHVAVNVSPRPVVDVTAFEVDFCEGGSTRLTANVDNYNLTNLTYKWTSSNPAEDMSWAMQRVVDVTPADTTTYTVTVYQVGSECVSVDSIKLNVAPIPVIDSVTVSDYFICEGGQVTVKAHITIPTGVATDQNYFYTWFRNGVEIPNIHGDEFSESPLTVDGDVTSYTYTAIVHQIESGCTSIPEEADPLTVYRNPIPVIDGDQYVCETSPVSLVCYTDTTSISVGQLHYQWYVNGQLRDNMAYGYGDSRYFSEYLYPRTEPYRITVEVTRGHGCSRFSDEFLVYVEERPLVEITATETDVCEGGVVTMTANLENYHHNDLMFQWYTDRVSLATEIHGATQYTYTTPALDATTRYIVRVKRERSECFAVDTIDINVYPDPVIDSITVSNAVLCDGGEVVVTAHATLNNTLGNYTYTWFRNGVLIPGVTERTFTDYPVVVDNDATNYTYSAIVSQVASGCTSVEVAAAPVVVNPHPTVLVVADASTVVCEGGEVVLRANVDPINNDYQYVWYRDNVVIGYDANVQYVRGLPAREEAYQYYVSVISNPGCTTASAPIEVNVVADPIVTIEGTETAVCEGGTAILTASFTAAVEQINGLGTYSYTWYNNGVEVGTGNTYQIPTNLPVGNYAYSVVLTFDNPAYGCDVNSAVQGGRGIYNFEVVADPQPVIVVTTGFDPAVCQGGTTQLSVDHINGGLGEASYQWFRNGVVLAGETNATLTTDPTLPVADYTYQVRVTMSGVDCQGMSNTITVPVMVKPTAVITGVENVCIGGQITLTATVDNTYGQNVQYQWNKVENGHAFPINGATASTYTTDTLLLAGSYSYSVTVVNPISGCTFTSTARNANVVADPTVRILGNEPVCQGGTVELVAEVSGGIAGINYNYTWYRNDQVVGANASTYTTDATLVAGNYYYRVEITPTDNLGCNAISAMVSAPVIAVPQVTISGIATVCQGGSVELSANVQPTGTYNYVWYKDGQIINTPNAATVVTDATLAIGNYVYGVEVYNNELGTSCSATATFNYQVVADPVVDTIITSLPANQMCAGGNVTLNAYVSGALAANNMVYTWTRNGEVLPNATLAQVTQNLTTPGTYTYTVVATNADNSALGCQSQPAVITIEVVPQPYVAIYYNGLLQVCEGGFVELSTVIEGGVDQPSIRWRMNGAQMSQFNDMTTIQTPTSLGIGSYNYSVDVIYPAATGCAVATNTNPVTVSVVNNPIWQTSVARYPDLCVGDQVELEASIAGGVVDANGQTGTYIQWVYAPVNAMQNVANVVGGLGGVTYDITTTPGIYTYYPTYVAPANSNCAPSNTPNASIITVHELPTATMQLANGSDVICFNNEDDQASIILNFTGTAPFSFMIQDMTTNEIYSYDNIYTSTYTINVHPQRTTTYQILNLSDRYCTGVPQNIGTVKVVVSNLNLVESSVTICPTADYPVAVFNFVNLTINDSRDTLYYDLNDYNNIGFDYVSGPVVVNGQTATAQVYMPSAAPGTYQFGIIIDSCEYDVTVTVQWSSNFAGRIMDQKWDDVVVCNNNPQTNGGYRFVSFQWYRNGVAIPGATNQYYQEVGGLNGFYSLQVIDENGVEYFTCEEQFAGRTTVRVYPVPARINDVITIELPLTDEQLNGAVLDIFDARGAHVRSVNHLNQITTIQGFHAQGTYFGRIITGTNEVKTVKFIVVK